MIIRYGNHIEFETTIYDSIKDFDRESLGTLAVYNELADISWKNRRNNYRYSNSWLF